MGKHIGTLARILLALVGLTVIVYSVTWQDQVRLPAGFTLPGGRTLREPMVADVVKPPTEPGGEATIRLGKVQAYGSGASAQPFTVDLIEPGDAEGSGPDYVPGIFSTLRQAQPTLLLLGLVVAGGICPAQAFRWASLLKARSLPATTFKAFRLTMVGMFFNYCMPGTTGGDVVKAYYVAARSDRRADAIMSIFVDRLTGMLGLVTLAGVMGLFVLSDENARQIVGYVWLLIAMLIVGALVYSSKTLRRVLGVNWLLQRIPGGGLIAKVDQALLAYQDHKGAVGFAWLMGMVNHSVIALATAAAGYALGLQTPLGLLLVIVPILFMAAAIPITPQGLGVMEALAMALLLEDGVASGNQIVGMLLLIRAYILVYSLLGSLFLLGGDIHLQDAKEAEEELVESEPAAAEHRS